MSSVIGVIPARFDSKRFPGKLLADLAGKTVLEWTWQLARQADRLDNLVIASGDARITETANSFGAEVIKVYSDCPSGSDRIEKAVKSLEANGCDSNIVVNIQGDEPMLEPGIIDVIISRLESDSNAGVATPIAAIKTLEEFLDPSVVKTVIDSCNHALYFSRQPIPHGWSGSGESAFRHIGLYAYRRDILKEFTCWRPCSLEKLEQLEQLRLLHHGVTIAVAVVESVCPGVDTEEDLEKIRKLWSKSWN